MTVLELLVEGPDGMTAAPPAWEACLGKPGGLVTVLESFRRDCVRAELIPACAGSADHAPWCGPEPAAQTEGTLVDIIAEAERLKHALAALQARATDVLRSLREEAAGHDRKARADAVRSVGAEVGLARRESPWWGDRRVALAAVLPAEMPETWAHFLRGDITERVAQELLAETSGLTHDDRAEVDRRLSAVLPTLTLRQVAAQAKRISAELDAASVVARMAAAVACRRVSVRPAPNGMAYLTVLGPLQQVIGAHAALARHAAQVCGGLTDVDPGDRTPGQVAADTALELLAGRASGEPQPVAIHLVMTDRALLGTGDPARSTEEPAWLPGHGMLPTAAARAWVSDPEARVWLQRLYTHPDTGDLVAMESAQRGFAGHLRQMVLLRDDHRCVTPWCDAPARHVDHTVRHTDGGATSYENGAALCERCNYTRETPGWVITKDPTGPPGSRITRTPTGATYRQRRVGAGV